MKKPFLGENLESLMSVESTEDSILTSPIDVNTGRYLITLKTASNSFATLRKICKSKVGLKIASTRDFKDRVLNEDDISDADVLIFHNLGIALLGPEDTDKIGSYIEYDKEADIREEQIVYPSTIPNSSIATWGIEQTNTIPSNFTGAGVKVAILDTGIDLQHPDFTGRIITTSSFVPTQTVQDMVGHGTHCIGTACGNKSNIGVRYGIASNAHIFAGKVLDNTGRGAQAWILAGMQWAGNNGCRVISMSLGSPVSQPGFDAAYEKAAKFVLSKGGVVVAAAGNESSRRTGFIAPVVSPANCPSILAVAALDANVIGGNVNFNVADFSCGSVFPNPGSQVDIAGPGVGVFSAWPMPTRYRAISGTSMATPHVAGLLALLWEQFPTATPSQITTQLFSNAKRLTILNTDIGVGLATAR